MGLFSINLPKRMSSAEPEEIKKLNSYLYKLNEELRYLFENLNPEDNFSNEAFIAYKQEFDKIAAIEANVDEIKASYVTAESLAEIKLTVEGISQNYVGKNNIIQSINLSNEGVKISGSVIKLEGLVTANENFKINTDGSVECVNAKFSGKVVGSEISGGKIEGAEFIGGIYSLANGNFSIDAAGNIRIKGAWIDGTTNSSSIGADLIHCNNLVVQDYIDCSSTINCSSLECQKVYAELLYGTVASMSDRRLKHDIEAIEEDTAEEIVRNLRPVSFYYNEGNRAGAGFIAQEVQAVCSETRTKLPLYEKINGYYCIPYQNFIPVLVKVVQQLMKKVERYENNRI